MQIFISHSSKNAEEAEKICALLERNGEKCFIAPRDIHSGKEYAEELIDGIDSSTAMILLMSEDANQSPHVLREVERAVSKSIPILVYKLEEVSLSKSMEYFLMTHQWVSAKANENGVDILRFVKGLKKQTDSASKDAESRESAQKKQEPKIAGLGKRSNSVPMIALLITVVAAALLIVGGRYYFVKRNQEQNTQTKTVAVGDTVTFGSYNGEEILWRVLKLSDDGTQAVLVSTNVLTMKAFDTAESGKYNWYNQTSYWSQDSETDTDMELQALVRGNSDWSTSNIRTWLNSDSEVVSYADQAPVSRAMAEGKNGYQNEAGFLHGFTAKELSAIVDTEIVTNANALSEKETVTTTDRVYLLSLEELSWFDEAEMSKFAVPTQAAMEQDNSNWYLLDYNDFGIKECCWWLREPLEGTACKCYLVGNGYTQELLREENVGLEGFGIRPAVTVNLQTVSFKEWE